MWRQTAGPVHQSGKSRHNSIFLQLMTHLSRALKLNLQAHAQFEPKNRSERERTIINDTISFIEHNYAANHKMEIILDHFKLNYSWLAWAFKMVTGISVYDYLTRIKLGNACCITIIIAFLVSLNNRLIVPRRNFGIFMLI